MNENYCAYLIRFKRRENQSSWCATLENVHTRETLKFATERELLVYLLQILSEPPNLNGLQTEDSAPTYIVGDH